MPASASTREPRLRLAPRGSEGSVSASDTGATNIGIAQSEADRLGLDYRSGRRGYSGTANGSVPVYLLPLDSIRIGDVQVYNVEATVLPGQMSHVLLGNSFLTRFQMRRENDKLTLERRY